jgi:methyl-accepting chemotaxis protein
MSKVRDKVCDELEIANSLLDEGEAIQGELVKSANTEISEISEHINHILEDYADTRDVLKSLVEKAEIALDGILHLAKESESARVYEVASNLVRTISDVSKEVVQLHKTMRELQKETKEIEKAKNEVVNNNLFVGTSADLDKLIQKTLLGKSD